MNSQGLNFNLTIFNCLIAVTMLELLGMLRRSHYSGISTSRGYNFPLFSIFSMISKTSTRKLNYTIELFKNLRFRQVNDISGITIQLVGG